MIDFQTFVSLLLITLASSYFVFVIVGNFIDIFRRINGDKK